MFFGNWPLAALIIACTSPAAPSMLRSRSNCRVICVCPCTLTEVICATPGICANCRSSGCATVEAIVSGLAPGYLPTTLMVGKSTRGSGATGRNGKAAKPTSTSAAVSSEVAMGRRMKGVEMLMAASLPCPQLPVFGATGAASSRAATLVPACRRDWPAMTTVAPSVSPSAMTALPLSSRDTVTGWTATLLSGFT